MLRIVEDDHVQDRLLKHDFPCGMVDERHVLQVGRHGSEDGSGDGSDTFGEEDAFGAFLTSVRLDSISGEVFDDDVDDHSWDVIKQPCTGRDVRTVGDASGCINHDDVYVQLLVRYLTW